MIRKAKEAFKKFNLPANCDLASEIKVFARQADMLRKKELSLDEQIGKLNSQHGNYAAYSRIYGRGKTTLPIISIIWRRWRLQNQKARTRKAYDDIMTSMCYALAALGYLSWEQKTDKWSFDWHISPYRFDWFTLMMLKESYKNNTEIDHELLAESILAEEPKYDKVISVVPELGETHK
jgi:hypothetical protein